MNMDERKEEDQERNEAKDPSDEEEQVPMDEQDEQTLRLEKEIEKLQETASGYLSQLQRVQADFENYQKRVEKERVQIADIACSELIAGLLETLDNFDRALESLEKLPPEDVRGIKMVYERMLSYLQGCGLERIGARGCEFDPNRHEAIMQAPVEDRGDDGRVVDEFECGYIYKDRVLRPAKVKVGKKMNNQDEENNKEK